MSSGCFCRPFCDSPALLLPWSVQRWDLKRFLPSLVRVLVSGAHLLAPWSGFPVARL